MSTKCTELYGKNFHFYYDWKDCDYRLEIYDNEIAIPEDFKDTLMLLSKLLHQNREKEKILKEIKDIEKLK